MGFLHSYTTGSAVDGPGVRVVAWTSGCMWRCRYCHNPDTWKIGNGLPVSVARAVEVLRKYAHGLSVMSGGFTLSGGEPLMQHRFAAKLMAAAKDMRVHTVIETNGYFSDRLSDADLANIDLVMLGIKSWGEDRHKDLTGVDLAPTLDFARRLATLRQADVDPVRAGARPHRRSRHRRRHRRVRGGTRQRRSALTCCPFTRWAVSSGRRWDCRTALNDVAPPTQESHENTVGHLPGARADRALTSRSPPANFGGNVWGLRASHSMSDDRKYRQRGYQDDDRDRQRPSGPRPDGGGAKPEREPGAPAGAGASPRKARATRA